MSNKDSLGELPDRLKPKRQGSESCVSCGASFKAAVNSVDDPDREPLIIHCVVCGEKL
ncbi:hypothetical protein [Haloprofundus halobius]|uniref:hypothetical protein n=1 Tax=Haloprofundus halobius TaxID=2876194 RepID=UPI001CCB7486|nr:hypothetical protein [Haloprofundus halobius]